MDAVYEVIAGDHSLGLIAVVATHDKGGGSGSVDE
jgi:hypothetical protein